MGKGGNAHDRNVFKSAVARRVSQLLGKPLDTRLDTQPDSLRTKTSAVRPISFASEDRPITLHDVTSWTSVGWYVAALLGAWGALIGTGEQVAADICFLLALVLAMMKWSSVTHLFRPTRRLLPFIIGLVLCATVALVAVRFAYMKTNQAQEQERKLAQLDLLPKLESEAQQIPDLKSQLSQIPILNQKVEASALQATAAMGILSRFLKSQGADTQRLGNEALNNITGGDSWGWAGPRPFGDGVFGFALINEGHKYPLRNVRVFVTGLLAKGSSSGLVEDFQCNAGDVSPHTIFDLPQRCAIHPNATKINDYLITIGANNGGVSERLVLTYAENAWKWEGQVFRTSATGQQTILKTF